MRAPIGLHFLGQTGTFVYLTQTMRFAPEFDVTAWPQFSVYNLLVANFWPVYWAIHILDAARLNRIYWHVFDVAAARATELAHFAHAAFSG
jgi:hypothetical protein